MCMLNGRRASSGLITRRIKRYVIVDVMVVIEVRGVYGQRASQDGSIDPKSTLPSALVSPTFSQL